LRASANRMAVSVPTLIRMEKGDPSVGMGGYATALPEVAAPVHDVNALKQDIEGVRQGASPADGARHCQKIAR